MRNGSDTKIILDLPIQSDVRVWREKHGWTGPFKLIANDGETCIIDMPYGPTNFRSTVVKPYYATSETPQKEAEMESFNESTDQSPPPPTNDITNQSPSPSIDDMPSGQSIDDNQSIKRGRGRPKGSKNKVHYTEGSIITLSMSFIIGKEQADHELSLKLRKKGQITVLDRSFEASDR